MLILAINLGSTSTKAGLFEGETRLCEHTIRHDKEELMAFGGIPPQKEYRKAKLIEWLDSQGVSMDRISAVAARGGLIRPVQGGVFRIDQAAADDAQSGKYGIHPANLGMLIAREWSLAYGIPAVFVDAPATDELSGTARISGFNGIARRSVFHALNAKRAVRQYCRENGLDPYNSRFVVAHMGGGITVSAIENMRAVDVSNGVDGEGPFSPERAGSLPARQLLELLKAYGGSADRLMDDLYRRGGLQSYFGSNDVAELALRAKSEPDVKIVLDAMIYNVAKWIGAMAAALQGNVSQVLLTGGIAYNTGMMDSLIQQVKWIAGCTVYPGEDELAALAQGAYRFLSGEEEAKSIEA